MSDLINHPPHYSCACHCPKCGEAVEVINITERHGFALGNALKYILRAGLKGDRIEDLKKARWYLDRIIDTEAAK